MTTPYVDIVDGRIDVDSPGDTGLMTDFRNDLRHLYERLNLVGIVSSGNIYDDFHQGTLDTDLWIDTGDNAPTFDAAPDHSIQFSTTGIQSSAIVAGAKRMLFDLDRDHHIKMVSRFGKATAAGDQSIIVGFQEAALTGDAVVTDTDSMIGFVRGTNANTIKAYCSKTAGNFVNVADNLSNWTAYMELAIEITFIGATKKVEFFVDGTSVGSTTDTAKIPVVQMRPAIGQHGGGGGRTSHLDYATYFWIERPLST